MSDFLHTGIPIYTAAANRCISSESAVLAYPQSEHHLHLFAINKLAYVQNQQYVPLFEISNTCM